MKITLVTIGALKTDWLKEGAAEYLKRLKNHFKFEVLALPPSKSALPDKQQLEESEAVLKHLTKVKGLVWVLDLPAGRQVNTYTSESLADDIAELSDRGESLTLVIGGAYGLAEGVKKRANKIIKLSDMTLPHELCQVVLLEQLYRAGEIIKGSGYHH